MQSFAQLVPLIILIPSLGAIINFFWGMKFGEKWSAIIGTTASALTFVIAVLLLSYLNGNDYVPVVIDPPILGNWIEIGGEHGTVISWQMRVDTLSVTMMMFVTFVGSFIHLYAAGYMHGDPRFARFFAYLNMFLAFMLILIIGNNYLMMFVGWEGVGLCSYLLIGFWWDKPNGEGLKNSDAARKAFIANRVGDFGMLMAIFLIFWAFGTLDFYKPGELANPDAGHHEVHPEDADGEEPHDEDANTEEGEGDHEEGSATFTTVAYVPPATQQDDHGDDAADAEHAEEDDHAEADDGHGAPAGGHNEVVIETFSYADDDITLEELGVFGQAEYLVENDAERKFNIGPLELELETLLVLITLFLLLGASGKSAQIPLFVWLPDAMAGPTPVSALIHAATMVTAGVYMMVRSNVLFHNAEFTSFVVTLIGATTALVAGFIAVGQWDIKRVLAYSTVSQLGFMVAAVGIGAYGAAIFHMVTHAFFKALLFLGSGSVIHGVEHGHHHAHHHEHGDDDEHGEEFDPQDMRNMGGLSRKMPITYITYLVGTLALAGIWPLAGFWSKDEILADSWLAGLESETVLAQLGGYFALGMLFVAAGFTAFYMWRQIEMVFHGKPRSEAADHAPESVWQMTLPLVVLAFFSALIGFINIPTPLWSGFSFFLKGIFGEHAFTTFLEHSVLHAHAAAFQPHIALVALGLGLGAIFLARSIYGHDKSLTVEGKDPLQVNPSFGTFWSLANARLYWDEIYFAFIIRPYQRIGSFLADVIDWRFLHDYLHDTVIYRGYHTIGNLLSKPFDLGIIDGIVNGVAKVVVLISGRTRQVQTGYVRSYAVMLLLGVVLVVIIMLIPLIQN